MKIHIKREGFDGEVVLSFNESSRLVSISTDRGEYGLYCRTTTGEKLMGYHYRTFKRGLGLTVGECDALYDGKYGVHSVLMYFLLGGIALKLLTMMMLALQVKSTQITIQYPIQSSGIYHIQVPSVISF